VHVRVAEPRPIDADADKLGKLGVPGDQLVQVAAESDECG
jgi:hypothetical protein